MTTATAAIDENAALRSELARALAETGRTATAMAHTVAENKALKLLVEKLTLEMATLKKRLFGRQSEGSDHLDLQPWLFDVTTIEIEAPPPSDTNAPTAPAAPVKKPRGQPQRMVLPDNLPVITETISPPADQIEGLVKIGVETSDRLAYSATSSRAWA